MSAVDFTRAPDRYNAALCRQGLGALLAKLAAGLPVQLATPATAIEWDLRSGIEVATPRGRILAAAAIVTVSTNVLTAGKIRFSPELPRRYLDAASRLKLGSFDHIALELPDNPLGLRSDELVFEKSSGPRTAAIFANTSGSTLCVISVGGDFGLDLAAKGEKEMVAFALAWLSDLYGADMAQAVKRTHATRWNQEPWVLGGFSTAAPGAQPARRALLEPMRNRIWSRGRGDARDAMGHRRRRLGIGRARRRRRAADAGAPMSKPKALIAWSSGKDCAWALHEVRRAGDYDIVGALTTVTETFDRVSMHGVRDALLMAQLEAVGLPSTLVHIPFPCPNEVYEARMAATLAAAKTRRHHACDLRRSVSRRRARLSRAEARRHRHHAAVPALAPADGGAGARDDRRGRRDLSGLRRSQAAAESRLPAAALTTRCSPSCRTAPILAARTASFTPSSPPARCCRAGSRCRLAK